jgi:hypothetical protein
MYIHYNKLSKKINVHYNSELIGTLPLSFHSIYGLFDSVSPKILKNGVSLRIDRNDLLNPMVFELLMHVVMVNMVCKVHPEIHNIFKESDVLLAHSMDAEINYIKNASLNLNFNHAHILSEYFKNFPVIAALPGPSLDLDFIKENRDFFVLFAIGRAAGKLIENGIYPDIIYIQDVNTAAWQHNFDSIKGKRIPSILIANPLGRIEPYKDCFRRIFRAWNLFPFERDCFPRLREISPSSLSGGYSLIKMLGFDPVLFVGNDCGINHPPKEHVGLPDVMTNLEYEVDGNDLVFYPYQKRTDIYLRFGDEFSVTTMNEYVAGSQWLKMTSREDVNQTGRKLYDRSLTRLCQFNSIIKDFSKMETAFRRIQFPLILPYYENINKPLNYLNERKKVYQFILRQLNKGIVPASSMRKPYSSIYYGTSVWKNDVNNFNSNDIEIATDNTKFLLSSVEESLHNIDIHTNTS